MHTIFMAKCHSTIVTYSYSANAGGGNAGEPSASRMVSLDNKCESTASCMRIYVLLGCTCGFHRLSHSFSTPVATQMQDTTETTTIQQFLRLDILFTPQTIGGASQMHRRTLARWPCWCRWLGSPSCRGPRPKKVFGPPCVRFCLVKNASHL